MQTVAQFIIERLIQAGVKRVYGLCGDSMNAFTEAMRTQNKITWVPVRHEETAAFAAGAEAHLTDSLVVCAGSCGPGNLHLINGLYDCFRNCVPVFAIATDIPTAEIGSQYFQETRPEQIYRNCTGYCERIVSVTQLPHVVDTAIQTAISRSTVSMIVISGDIALSRFDFSEMKNIQRAHRACYQPPEATLEDAASILNKSQKIVILGGAGCKGAHKELVEIAQLLKSPIVHAMRGKEYIEYDNPFDVGMTGLLGFSSGYQAMMNCDTLLMLGTDFPYRQFFPKDATILQIDHNPGNIGKRTPIDFGMVGDVPSTLKALIPKIKEKTDSSFLNAAKENYEKARESLNDLAVGHPGKKPIHPQYVAKMISDLADEDTVFACDVGTPTIWASRYLKMNGKRRLLGSFNHGSMANSIPQAIGAQMAFPKRQVITLSGDGGFSMLMGELLTLRQLNAPVKMVIFNNGAYGFVELEMKAFGFLSFGTDMNNPNFADLAQSIGLFGARVEDPADLEPALKKAFSHKGPAVVDVVVNRLELSMPPRLKLQEIVGFNLWMAKAVLNGKGSEVIELAKTNLFR